MLAWERLVKRFIRQIRIIRVGAVALWSTGDKNCPCPDVRSLDTATQRSDFVRCCSFSSLLFVQFVVVRVMIVPSVQVWNASGRINSGTASAGERSFRRAQLAL